MKTLKERIVCKVIGLLDRFSGEVRSNSFCKYIFWLRIVIVSQKLGILTIVWKYILVENCIISQKLSLAAMYRSRTPVSISLYIYQSKLKLDWSLIDSVPPCRWWEITSGSYNYMESIDVHIFMWSCSQYDMCRGTCESRSYCSKYDIIIGIF